MTRKIISILAGICLSVSFLAAGLDVCAGVPQISKMLAEANSDYRVSPYPQDTLVRLACETRDFTVLDYGRSAEGDEAATSAFYENISQIAGEPYNALDSKRFLDENAISHLNDVNSVIAAVFWPLAAIAVAAIAALAYVIFRYGKRAGGNVLLASGTAMLVIMAAIALWAALGFDAFFAAFHSLFFAEGTWTFPYDSLLICMYPIGFWIGMAAIWAATTAVLSIAAVIIGFILRRKRSIASGGDFSDQLT